MCGIVGILGTTPVAPLTRRCAEAARISRLRFGRRRDARGRPARRAGAPRASSATSRRSSTAQPLSGRSGIGHTRWATHGAPTETNAHPHATERLALVHNGIIENFRELKIGAAKTRASSSRPRPTPRCRPSRHAQSASAACRRRRRSRRRSARLEGAFALAILFEGEDDLMIGARRGSPLAIGHGDGEMFFGSDAIALAPFTDRITYLEDGDWAVLTRAGATIYDEAGNAVERPTVRTLATSLLVDKGNHRHFMAKEIYEQPEVVGHTLAHYLDFATGRTALPADFDRRLRRRSTGCRSPPAARPIMPALVAKYWFERFARLPVDIDIASEFRYREQPLSPRRACRSSSRSRARPPTRWPRCAMPRARGRRSPRSSTCRPRPSRARPISSCRRSPGRRSASPRPRPSPRSSRCSAPLAVAAGRARGVLSREDEERLVRALQRSAALHEPGAAARGADRAAGARALAASSMCSISAAAPASRSRSKAR